MKPVVCFYRSDDSHETLLFDSPDYERAYRILAKAVHAEGGSFAMVKGHEYFLGKGDFARGWLWNGEDFLETTERFHADIVYDNVMEFDGDNATHLVNDRRFHEMCMKDRTLSLFPSLLPQSFVAHSQKELTDGIGTMQGKLVSKPADSYGGSDVLIGSASFIIEQTEEFPSIIQQFIDTSRGIPGIVDGMHDLRLLVIGGHIADCYVRSPAPGKELANVMQGGSIRQVPIDMIPPEALAMVREIDAAFTQFPDRVYSADVGLVDGKDWYLFELNSPPGLPTDEDHGDCEPYLHELARHLVTFAKTSP